MKNGLEKLEELRMVTPHEQFDLTVYGFSVCAGYLSAIFEQLRSPDVPMSDKEFQAAFHAGEEQVVGRLLEFLEEYKKETPASE